MAEEVNTGGLKKFVSKKSPKIEPELAKNIDEGYEKADIRKVKERRNKIILVIIIILILLVLGIVVFTLF